MINGHLFLFPVVVLLFLFPLRSATLALIANEHANTPHFHPNKRRKKSTTNKYTRAHTTNTLYTLYSIILKGASFSNI